jgi:eukaryotic-like serine/threonine-protein kinase
VSEPKDRFLDRVSGALAGRYRVERELGRGGMAVVYLADDPKHHRQVAVKVLEPELAAAIGGERFLREIQIAAQLNHPHILPLHDSGEADGLLYYVMPFVTGESLRQRLEREGQLPLDDALRITSEVASALGHAHMHGFVHRDVKPENILLSGGYALVADFGIARAVTTAGGDQFTTAGITIGTPAYMSPEQAMAAPQLDGRTDQYSLACVLYEMLTGAPPFSGPSAQAVLARHTLDPVPPVRTLRSTVPPAVEQAMLRALAKVPADRYPTTAAFQVALTAPSVARPTWRPNWRLVAYALAGVALVAGAYVAWSRRGPPPPIVPLVALLPFETIGGDSAFSAGMTFELSAKLGQIPGLKVAPPTTSSRYQNADDREKATLGVAYVVKGATQYAAKKLRVTVTINNATGNQIWTRTYEPPGQDVFAVQDSISHDIAGVLQVHLSVATVTLLGQRPTDNPQAHELYLRGRFFYEKRGEANLRKALEYFQSAIGLDSNYALAYSGLADTYSLFVGFSFQPAGEYFPRAREAALRALALDSTLAEAHTSLGFIALLYDWDRATAQREFDRALAINPNYVQAQLFHSYLALTAGRMDESIQEVRHALTIEPFSLILNTRLATAFYHAHRYEEALTQDRKTRELDPTFLGVPAELVRSSVMLGRCTAALAAIAAAPNTPSAWWQAIAANAHARCRQRSTALADLSRLQAEMTAGRPYVSHYDVALVYAGLGDAEHALAELDSAVVTRDFLLFSVAPDQAFDGLRADPRFARIVRRIGLWEAN